VLVMKLLMCSPNDVVLILFRGIEIAHHTSQ